MKTCPECSAENPLTALLCSACETVLEESFYLRTITFCSALAVGLHGVLVALGFYARFSVAEVFVLATALLLVIYPACKLHQKRLRPDRPIGREMLSVHGDRWSRFMLTGLLLAFVYFPVHRPPSLTGLLNHLSPATATPLAVFQTVRAWAGVGMAFGAFVIVLVIIRSQGLAFFDFRIANTWRERTGAKGAEAPEGPRA
jgi:hypothetical protein